MIQPLPVLSHRFITVFFPGYLQSPNNAEEVHFGTSWHFALSLQFNMWPTTSFNAKPNWKFNATFNANQTPNWKRHGHSLERFHKQNASISKHSSEKTSPYFTVLSEAQRVTRLHWCCLSRTWLQHQDLQAMRALGGSWVWWKPYREEGVWGGSWNT